MTWRVELFKQWHGGMAASVAVAALALGTPTQSQALAVGVDFAADYTVTSLGSVSGLPTNYGGLTFLNNNTLLIGGNANSATGSLYTVGVVRDANNHVTGFSGSATKFGTAIGEFNDGGVTFGPGGVLFTSRWPINESGQTKPGSTSEDKVIDLAALGVAAAHSAVYIVPAGFGGAGQIKLVSYSGGQFYSASLVPDGAGTFDLVGLMRVDVDPTVPGIQSLPGGPEGFVYIDGANDGFDGFDSMLMSDYGANRVSAYRVDANGNPDVTTRRDFITGLSGAEGAAIDPLTGDFMFSTFGSGNQVVVVQGFLAPPPPPTCGVAGTPPCATPEPDSLALAALALLGSITLLRRRRR